MRVRKGNFSFVPVGLRLEGGKLVQRRLDINAESEGNACFDVEQWYWWTQQAEDNNPHVYLLGHGDLVVGGCSSKGEE